MFISINGSDFKAVDPLLHPMSTQKFPIVFALLAIALLVSGCAQQQGTSANNSGVPVLTIYTYDSMVSEYGLGPKVIPKFEAQCGCKVNMVAKGDAGQVLSALMLEKENPRADVAIGIDNSMLSAALNADVLAPFTPGNISLVPENLRFDKSGHLTAYDYGYFAFVYDSDALGFDLNGFNSMLDSRLRKKVLIQNPRTSSPGLGLLLWTVAVYGDPGYKEFWREFAPNVLTVTAGWDESAGLFSAGEAPVYLSYATSPPYYVLYENRTDYIAGNFAEGHYVQVEGMGIVNGAKNRALAEEFIAFSLTEPFQEEIPLNQYMFPINHSVELPDAYKYALKPSVQLELDPALVEQKQEEWISEWEKIMSSS